MLCQPTICITGSTQIRQDGIFLVPACSPSTLLKFFTHAIQVTCRHTGNLPDPDDTRTAFEEGEICIVLRHFDWVRTAIPDNSMTKESRRQVAPSRQNMLLMKPLIGGSLACYPPPLFRGSGLAPAEKVSRAVADPLLHLIPLINLYESSYGVFAKWCPPG